jgi:MYXO-CTERM domain-containing protein
LREDTGLNKNHVNMVRRWRTVVKADVTSSNTVVSEPATGALALAGVALLFKRRRA